MAGVRIDPAVFGRLAEEAHALAEARIPFEIVPGITAALAAASYAAIPLTDRDKASAAAACDPGVVCRDRLHVSAELSVPLIEGHIPGVVDPPPEGVLRHQDLRIASQGAPRKGGGTRCQGTRDPSHSVSRRDPRAAPGVKPCSLCRETWPTGAVTGSKARLRYSCRTWARGAPRCDGACPGRKERPSGSRRPPIARPYRRPSGRRHPCRTETPHRPSQPRSRLEAPLRRRRPTAIPNTRSGR